jgi:uncharacterized membrane protein
MTTQLRKWSASALAAVLGVSLLATPVLHAAGKPGGSTTTTQILPTSLGALRGCSSSYGLAINNGTYPYALQAVGQGTGCPDSQAHPFLWSAATAMIDVGTPAPTIGGSAEGVSEDGTVVGWAVGGGAGLALVRRPSDAAAQQLPTLPGMTYASANQISPSGHYIAGSSSTDTEGHAVLWTIDTRGAWQVTDLGRGGAIAVTDSGTVVGGSFDQSTKTGTGWVKTLNNARVALPGHDTRVHDISPSGKVIVGYRLTPTTRDPTLLYEVPVVWKQDSSGRWSASDLQALDGVDSEAMGVGERNGKEIIVGYGYTKKDAIMRAVAWLPDSSGNYGAPIRLGALNGRSTAWATARDVNSSGKVIGASAGNGLTRFAVLWTLP